MNIIAVSPSDVDEQARGSLVATENERVPKFDRMMAAENERVPEFDRWTATAAKCSVHNKYLDSVVTKN